jgi:hypothetical protein
MQPIANINSEKARYLSTAYTIKESAKENKLLIYLHIPKAAGTTLNGIINQQYSRSSLFRFDGINNHKIFTELPQDRQNKIRVLRGHFAFGIHQFISRPCEYFTVLRNPIKRVISQYNYIRNNPDRSQHKLLQSISLEDYILQEGKNLCNQQTRMICGLSTPKDCSDRELLEIAQNNLDKHFAVVGITEMFDETLLMLKQKFDWKVPYYIKQNTAKDPDRIESISPKAISLIEEYGSLDLQLYDRAKHKLQERIDRQGELFQTELNFQKKINSLYQPFGKVYSASRHVLLKHIFKIFN